MSLCCPRLPDATTGLLLILQLTQSCLPELSSHSKLQQKLVFTFISFYNIENTSALCYLFKRCTKEFIQSCVVLMSHCQNLANLLFWAFRWSVYLSGDWSSKLTVIVMYSTEAYCCLNLSSSSLCSASSDFNLLGWCAGTSERTGRAPVDINRSGSTLWLSSGRWILKTKNL